VERPKDDTEPRVQRLILGLCQETGIGSQDLTGAGFCVVGKPRLRKEKTMRNAQNGFIQIPLLIALIVLGAVAAGGGYYAIQRGQKTEVLEEKDILEKGKIIENKLDTDETEESAIDFRVNEPARPPLESFLNNKVIDGINAKKTEKKNVEVDFKKFIAKAEEEIKRLEQDKNNFRLLRAMVNDHRQKSVNHAREILDDWINLAGENAATVPSEYKQILLLTKDSIVSNRESLVYSIEYFYETVNLRFGDSYRKQSKEDTIVAIQNEFNECIKLRADYNSADKLDMALCELSLENHEYAEDFIKITESLVEVDLKVLETISNYAKMAEDNIRGELDSISRHMNTMYTFQADLNQISQQAQRSASQLESGMQSDTNALTCKYPIVKHILVPGKGWTEVKQCSDGRYIEADKYVTDTSNMTPQQICDMRKAAWAGQDAIILPSPDCGDLGL